MRLYQLASWNFFSCRIGQSEFPPMLEQQVEIFTRRGLEPGMRALGILPGTTFTMQMQSLFNSDADVEVQLTAFRTNLANSAPMNFRRQREDGSFLDYDAYNTRFVLVHEFGRQHAIQFQNRPIRVASVDHPPWVNATIKTTFTFQLQPVVYP